MIGGGKFANGAYTAAFQYIVTNPPTKDQLSASPVAGLGIAAQETARMSLDLAGKAWTLPNTVGAFAVGATSMLWGARMHLGYNAIVFDNVPFQKGNDFFRATTIGNVILTGSSFEALNSDTATYYASDYGDCPAIMEKGFSETNWGNHEQAHTYQAQALGPLYLPVYFLSSLVRPFSSNNRWENNADRYGAGKGSWW